MNRFLIRLSAMASIAVLVCACRSQSFSFLAMGDMPYNPEQETKFRDLLKRASLEPFSFLVHVGDIKGQSEPCTDERFEMIRDIFREQSVPVVYTPGDNEWTDCGQVDDQDPIERLRLIRRLFFEDESTLRLKELNSHHQNVTPEFSRYPENYRFSRSGVLFVVVHVAGSANNRREDDVRSMEEYRDRNHANLRFLEESFSLAFSEKASAVTLIIHANPDFEMRSGKGFQDFLDSLSAFLQIYQKPVLCIHGDTHQFRQDHPLVDPDTNKPFPQFTRLEVFGSPSVAGVVVTVDPGHPEVFSCKPF